MGKEQSSVKIQSVINFHTKLMSSEKQHIRDCNRVFFLKKRGGSNDLLVICLLNKPPQSITILSSLSKEDKKQECTQLKKRKFGLVP